MTLEGIQAALQAGAGAVIAKSVNEAPGAARQLDIAEYVMLNSGMDYFAVGAGQELDASLFCRSGLSAGAAQSVASDAGARGPRKRARMTPTWRGKVASRVCRRARRRRVSRPAMEAAGLRSMS